MEAPGSPYASSPESAPKRAPRSPPQQQPPSEEGGNCHASLFSVPSLARVRSPPASVCTWPLSARAWLQRAWIREIWAPASRPDAEICKQLVGASVASPSVRCDLSFVSLRIAFTGLP